MLPCFELSDSLCECIVWVDGRFVGGVIDCWWSWEFGCVDAVSSVMGICGNEVGKG